MTDLVQRRPPAMNARRDIPPLANVRAWARETDRLVFTLAAAVIALHAAVDSFFAPEPGTGPATTCCAAVPRSRCSRWRRRYPTPARGRTRRVAAVLGVLALEGAGLAIADARAVGARGEDWTGFLLLPVGIVLCGSPSSCSGARGSPAGSATCAEARSRSRAVLAAYWLVVRSQSGSSRRTARVRPSSPPSSAGRTRR